MSTDAVVRVLGGAKVIRHKVKNQLDLMELSRKGVSMRALMHLAKILSLSMKEVAKLLQVSERNLQRYESRDLLNAAISGRVVQLAEVTGRGIEVFGDRERFTAWLDEPNRSLGGRKPFELLDTAVGTQLLLDELGRIEQGVYA